MKQLHWSFEIIAICIIICTGCYDNGVPTNGAVIEGNLTGIATDESIVAILWQRDGMVGKSIKKDTLIQGRFRFCLDTLDGGDFYEICLSKTNDVFEFVSWFTEIYLEPGAKVVIRGEGKYLYTAKISSPVKEQKKRQQFISKMPAETLREWQDMHIHQDFTKMDSISNVLNAQRLSLMENEPIGDYSMNLLYGIALSFLSEDHEGYRDEIMKIYGRLTDEQKQTQIGKEIYNYLQNVKKVSIGDVVPDYEYLDTNGMKHHISELAGKWVLVEFWSSGCYASIMALPEMAQLAKENVDSDYRIVCISVDTEKRWKEAMGHNVDECINWRDPDCMSGSIRAYFNGVPAFILIEPDGVIKDLGVEGYYDGLLHEMISKRR